MWSRSPTFRARVLGCVDRFMMIFCSVSNGDPRSKHLEGLLAGGWRKCPIDHREIVLGKLDVGRAAILPHVLRSSRLRNRDDSTLAKHPGKRHLGGSRSLSLYDMQNDWMRKQASLLDR